MCASLQLVSGAMQQDSDQLFAAVPAELERSLRAFGQQPKPPCYSAYEIFEIESSTSPP